MSTAKASIDQFSICMEDYVLDLSGTVVSILLFPYENVEELQQEIFKTLDQCCRGWTEEQWQAVEKEIKRMIDDSHLSFINESFKSIMEDLHPDWDEEEDDYYPEMPLVWYRIIFTEDEE